MMQFSHALFDTPVGRCGILWSEAGIVGVQLAERSDAATQSRLLRRSPPSREAPVSGEAERAVAGIARLLSGEPIDLLDISVDLQGVPAFDRLVYEAARQVRPGRVTTYGDIARQIGEPDTAREVGRALGANPIAIIVPCHRIVAAGGRLGGFSANGGQVTKRRLLEIEKARMSDLPDLFDAER